MSLSLLCRHACKQASAPSSAGPLRLLRTRSTSTAVAAWGAYLGRFAETRGRSESVRMPVRPLAAQSTQAEQDALLAPARLSLGRLLGSSMPADQARIGALGAGVRHALIAVRDAEDEFKTQLVGVGLNRCQQLGSASSSEYGPVITPIHGKVVQMACGREHSALLIERPDGSPRVAMCGSNAFGQLGFDILPTNGTFARLQKFSVTELDSLNDVLGAGEQPVKVQCGLDHTVILTSNGRAFAMGWGADGQLGAGPESNDSFDRPVMVSGLGGTSLVDISSSTDFTLALTAERRLYYWGNAEYGQCMTGTKIDQVLAPIQIPFDYGLVAGIAAGGSHALVLTDAGQVYSCGYGALGLGAKAFAALQPELIRGLRDIAAIFASTDRCLAIDTHQQVYSWGLGNAAGRLGNGTAGANAFEPELLDMTACSLAVDSAMVALGNDIALVALR